jgi:predicted transcriptional regulator
MTDAIISIKSRHVENILNGTKTVELRTKNINMPVGSKLWIYTTMPVGRVEASAEIQFVETLSPESIWIKYGKDIRISREEFLDYTKGRDVVTAIGLTDVESLRESICLETMRCYEKGFQPPQFISKLHPERELYSAFYA